ncbi:MAG TPA: polyprenyl synthetase family protein, partial [Anaerolineaceae bacterium]|nr:polyprenyl synthetase family protein [Anaerolineaceae bacterium]
MSLASFVRTVQPAVDAELRRVVMDSLPEPYAELQAMLCYHMGWEGETSNVEAQGKRIRPLLVLLSTAACGGDWKAALPAAAAVELLHNFSLIHDDVEDQSHLRRGRATLWSRWGSALAINAGDAMFSLANLAILRLLETASVDIAIQAAAILQQTCLHLTG